MYLPPTTYHISCRTHRRTRLVGCFLAAPGFHFRIIVAVVAVVAAATEPAMSGRVGVVVVVVTRCVRHFRPKSRYKVR